jgi:hypothetical protein
MAVGGQRHAPATLPPAKRPGTQCLGGCVRVQNISPPPGFDPRTVQPVASRFTEYAILTHRYIMYNKNELYVIFNSC